MLLVVVGLKKSILYTFIASFLILLGIQILVIQTSLAWKQKTCLYTKRYKYWKLCLSRRPLFNYLFEIMNY